MQEAFFYEDGGPVSRSLVDDIENPDFPTIVSTRSGSLIVDYAASFNTSSWPTESALINATTDLLELYYDNNFEEQLQYVPGSITVNSASELFYFNLTLVILILFQLLVCYIFPFEPLWTSQGIMCIDVI